MLENLNEKHDNVSDALKELDKDVYKEERDLLRAQKIRFVELLFAMASARDSYHILEPLLSHSNALTIALLVLLLLLLLSGGVGVSYWMTPRDDYRVYMKPPQPYAGPTY